MTAFHLVCFVIDLIFFLWYCRELPFRRCFRSIPIRCALLGAIAVLWFVFRFFTVDVMFLKVMLVILIGMCLCFDMPLRNSAFLALVFVTFLCAGGMIFVYPVRILTA